MNAKLSFRLFGVPQITLDGALVTGFVSNKAQALLIYLAVTARPHSRNALATLFWGDMLETSAQTNLRKALSNLRHLVGKHLAAEPRQPVTLERENCWIDVVAFAEKLSGHDQQSHASWLQAALDLYQGDFLEGFFVADAPDFEAWALAERTQRREQMLSALNTLANHHATQGDLTRAIDHARRLLQFAPWREDAHRHLIEWLARDGQHSAALAQYEICRQQVAAELGVEPASETVALYQRIRTGNFADRAGHVQRVERPGRHVPVVDGVHAHDPTLATVIPSRGTTLGKPLTPEQLLDTLPLTTLPAPAPLPPHSIMPLSKNRLFVGREQDLLTLAAALKAGGSAAVSQVETAAATGLGGIGKTQLACEFVHRYGQFFAGGVYWLSFAEAAAIPAEIAACGGDGALELRPDFGQRPLSDQIHLVQAVWQDAQPRLLIFDNCEDPALLAQWRPSSGGCRVLVTSRRSDWELVLGVKLVALGVLSRQESLALLQQHRPDIADTLLDAIAEELGDLPLALHLAGSYLVRYRRVVEPAEYLAELRDPHLLQHPSFQGSGLSPTKHIQHVGRTFALSYDRLDPTDETDALALALLVRAAHFAPGEPIWYKLLVKTLGLDPQASKAKIQADRAFSRLIDLGLVSVEQADILRMHRLVAAFVREVAYDQVQITQQAVETVVYAETAQVNRAGYPMPLLAWQLHLRAIVDVAKAREDTDSARLCNELGQHLWQIGDYQGAFPYYAKALAIRQQILGEDHPDTAQSLNRMGYLLQSQGKLGEAKAYFERALAVREKILGEEHADTAESLNDLGGWLYAQGDFTAARPYLERALQISHRVLGEEHPLTAEYANNLGMCIQNMGDWDNALLNLQRALAINEKVLGPEHPDTALSLNNIGFLFFKMDRLNEAKPYYERALAIRGKVLGKEHPDTGQTLNNLGALARAQGNWVEAQLYLEQALVIYEHTLGKTHPWVAYCLNHLGLLLQTNGKLDKARIHLERALAIRQETLEKIHPLTALSLHNLGMVLLAQGELDKGSAYLQDALAIRRVALGVDHPLTVETRNSLDRSA